MKMLKVFLIVILPIIFGVTISLLYAHSKAELPTPQEKNNLYNPYLEDLKAYEPDKKDVKRLRVTTLSHLNRADIFGEEGKLKDDALAPYRQKFINDYAEALVGEAVRFFGSPRSYWPNETVDDYRSRLAELDALAKHYGAAHSQQHRSDKVLASIELYRAGWGAIRHPEYRGRESSLEKRKTIEEALKDDYIRLNKSCVRSLQDARDALEGEPSVDFEQEYPGLYAYLKGSSTDFFLYKDKANLQRKLSLIKRVESDPDLHLSSAESKRLKDARELLWSDHHRFVTSGYGNLIRQMSSAYSAARRREIKGQIDQLFQDYYAVWHSQHALFDDYRSFKQSHSSWFN